MARDSQGNYTLPLGTLVKAGDTVLVSQHNPAMQDIEQALTKSLARDGRGEMQAPLKMGGNRVTNMADGVDPSDAATVAQIANGVRSAATLDALKAAPTADPLIFLRATNLRGYFFWTTGNFTGQADDKNIVAADGVALNVGAWVRQSGNSLRLDDLTNEVKATYTTANPLAWGFRLSSVSQGKQVDSILATADFLGASAAGYPFHGIAYADAGVGPAKVGGGGFAIDGPGPGSGGVGNRRGIGQGHGLIGTRDGTGSGAGVTGTAQGTGDSFQAGVQALKQNVNGQPGGDSSPGPALAVVNFADQGRAIESTTLENNADDVSNFYERRNVKTGVVSRRAILLGGARTGALVVDDVLIQPATPLTGAYAISGVQVTIRDMVTGATEATAFSASNAATGGAAAYGVVASVTGNNTNQAGGRFSASGGTNNYSIDCAVGVALFRDGVQALNLPVYADNAAAAAAGLAVGRMYRTADGTVKVAYSV